MNASEKDTFQNQNKAEGRHQAYLCLGSNIDPTTHLQKAVELLREQTQVTALSSCWETTAVGSDGPDFLNMAVALWTPLTAETLKTKVLAAIESQLGRVRSDDKNAPRTIDLDIIIFDQQVLDPALWRQVYLALPFSELLPELRHPESGQSLREVAQTLHQHDRAVLRSELAF